MLFENNEGKVVVLWADFIEIYIFPLYEPGSKTFDETFDEIKKVATEAFNDWFFRDEVEAIGTEIEWALEAAGYKENVDYRMFFYQEDDE